MLARTLGDDGRGHQAVEIGAERDAAIGRDTRPHVPGQRRVPGAIGVAQPIAPRPPASSLPRVDPGCRPQLALPSAR